MLEAYFAKLIEKVEASDISNAGKDQNGFYQPTRTLLLRHLQALKDLHGKPRARPMVVSAWSFVSENLPPEWLVLSPEEKAALKKVLAGT